MKKNKFAKIKIIISFIILFGFIAVAMTNYSSYSKIIKDDIHNISKLTSTNIYSEIDNELVKPIFVSLTMANDSFVNNWLNNENNSDEEEMIKYLDGIKKKYHYDSVFLVSDKTKKYYHYDGVFKEVSPKNDHDIWYYNFLEKDALYDLDVDQDEVDNKTLTVFVNCKIYDENGEFLGVTGVGIKMKYLQELLGYYKENFNLDAYLIDGNGLIQAHTNNNLIEKTNVFERELIKPLRKEIINKKDALLSFDMKYDSSPGYLISRYIKELNWYLIVEKDTSILIKSFNHQIMIDFFISTSVILIVLLISTILINKYKGQLIKVAQTDQLTNIMNRRAFDNHLSQAIKTAEQTHNSFSLFIFDIDNFKNVNDTNGHIFGDKIIMQIARIVSNVLKEPNIFARWGGDEFAGIIFGDEKKATDIAYEICNQIKDNKELSTLNITISLGITRYKDIDTSTTILIRADKGLYKSKDNGKNQVTII